MKTSTVCLTTILISLVFQGDRLPAQDSPHIARVGRLKDGFFFGDTTYRAVELKTPWLYALSRDGEVHVFEIHQNAASDFVSGFSQVFAKLVRAPINLSPEADRPLRLVKKIKDAGDGDDLEIFGDSLVLTSKGKLSVFDLVNPPNPKKIGEFGSSEAIDSQSIVRAGNYAFVLGENSISSFDMSDAQAPKYLTTLKNNKSNWNGCYDGKFLYVSETRRKSNHQTGIAVYDVSSPRSMVECHFVETNRLAYHLFVNNERHLIACLDSKSRFHFVSGKNITVAGSTQIFSLNDDATPKSVALVTNSGGRSATLGKYKNQSILFCNGLAFSSESNELKKVYSFFPHGSTLDGFPYHGDSYDQYSAIATDNDVSVFRIGEARFFKIGKRAAALFIFLLLQLF